MSIRVHPWLVLGFGGPKRTESGEKLRNARNTRKIKMGLVRFGAETARRPRRGGLQPARRPKIGQKGPKMAQNGILGRFGAPEGMQTRFSTANGRKFTQMGIGKGISAGKQEIFMKTGGETGLHRVFLLFPVFLFPTANGREWTRTRAQVGNFSRAGDRKYACLPAGSPRVRARGAPRLGSDRKSTGVTFRRIGPV